MPSIVSPQGTALNVHKQKPRRTTSSRAKSVPFHIASSVEGLQDGRARGNAAGMKLVRTKPILLTRENLAEKRTNALEEKTLLECLRPILNTSMPKIEDIVAILKRAEVEKIINRIIFPKMSTN